MPELEHWVTFKDIAVGNARANREGWIDQCLKIDTLEIFTNEGRSSVRAEVVGQLYGQEIVHDGLTLG